MPDLDKEFKAEGLAAGFTEAQIRFLDDWFTGYGHHHSIEEVDGLEDQLDLETVPDLDEEDEDGE